MLGRLEDLQGAVARGWVRVRRSDNPAQSAPVVTISIKGKLFAAGKATAPRPDLTSPEHEGYGFVLHAAEPLGEPISLADITASATCGTVSTDLSPTPILELATRIANLHERDLHGTLRKLDHRTRSALSTALRSGQVTSDQPVPRSGTACVVSHVNDSSAWFPYFYSHYSALVGAERIYIVTPNPASFVGYRLGGIVSAPEMLFDDTAKAHFVGNFANALRAFYRWSIVCDPDEIIVPHPLSASPFLELLERSDRDIIASRGIDVIQADDESDFDFDRPVLGQRRYGQPNMALYKPHFARVSVRYSGGYHYCDKPVDLPPITESFLTLHLKWACRRVRSDLQRIVAATAYADQRTAAYAASSADAARQHPLAQLAQQDKAYPLVSEPVERFEAKYRTSVKYITERDLWIGSLESANFLVRLSPG
jgi:hypothetical protein